MTNPTGKGSRGNFHLWSQLENVYPFAEDPENAAYSVGYGLTSKRNTDNDAIDRGASTANDKLLKGITWFVPQFTPNIPQQLLLQERTVSRASTEMHYNEKYVFHEDVNAQKYSIFELGVKIKCDVLAFVILVLQGRV